MPDSTGIVDKNRMNKTEGKHIHNYSTFNKSLSYRLYNTHRFGDYTPTFVMEGVPKDVITLNSLDRIDSLSLKAPFKGSIRKIKETFMVPNMAILPLQWDRIYAQNSNGDDVPNDANCILVNFPTSFKTLWSSALAFVYALPLSSWSEVYTYLTGLFRTMVLGEYIYSAGSLLNVLGYKSSTQFIFKNYLAGVLETQGYDFWFDAVCDSLLQDVSSITVIEPVGSGTVTHIFSNVFNISGYEPMRAMFELFRENPLCYVSNVALVGSTTFATFVQTLVQLPLDASRFDFALPSSSYTGNPADETSLNPNVLNLSRLLSYQLVCAHFYTNSSIDFIYSADLYRQYILTLINSTGYNAGTASFSWNGMNMPYDYLSGYILLRGLALTSTRMTTFVQNIAANTASILPTLAVWSAIFGFRKSLRYGDYFTASRPRPLAPINTDVSVNNNLVSVIDITRRIQSERFANAIMRSRSKIEEYVKSLFGNAPAPDFHNPFFLTRTEEIIFGDYVQNTGGSQTTDANSRTANFAANLDRYTFTFHNDDMHPCTYLQIVSYDTPRAYTRSVNRQFLHVDRFDMFNPDFQFIGDQPVYGIELGYYPPNVATPQIPNIFSYQSRDMEYKQRYDESASGFASGKLPGWCFDDSRLNWVGFQSINPDFIRSRNVDLDYLYLALTGYSLGNYFHFACITDNNVNAKRAMAVDPQILQ